MLVQFISLASPPSQQLPSNTTHTQQLLQEVVPWNLALSWLRRNADEHYWIFILHIFTFEHHTILYNTPIQHSYTIQIKKERPIIKKCDHAIFSGAKSVRKGSIHLSALFTTRRISTPLSAISLSNTSNEALTVATRMLPESSTKSPTKLTFSGVSESRPQIESQSEAEAEFPLSRFTVDETVRSIPSGLLTVSRSKPVGLYRCVKSELKESEYFATKASCECQRI